MKHLAMVALCALVYTPTFAQVAETAKDRTDSLPTYQVGEVVVAARRQRFEAEVSTYTPTARQKSASQDATDLLGRLSIPQLQISASGTITDVAGKPVDIFVDFLPATTQELQGMKMSDVKRVEYYDYPSDPRFLGKARVVNFVMQQYEYGGYVKPYAEHCFMAGTSQWALFSRVQRKQLTFDVAAGGFYEQQSHNGTEQQESFRLPQADGSINSFERMTSVDEGLHERQLHLATFRLRYATPKVQIRNGFGLTFDHKPLDRQSGTVTYTHDDAAARDYASTTSNRSNSLYYNGYFFFKLNDRNSLHFAPDYTYTRTAARNCYQEGEASYLNHADDRSHNLYAMLTYTRSFGEGGTLKLFARTVFNHNRTQYAGTAEGEERAYLLRYGPGAQYTLTRGKFYGLVGVGYNWDQRMHGDRHHQVSAPWVDVSLQYAPSEQHAARLVYHHSYTPPSSNHLSEQVIQRDAWMRYTGNPSLKSYYSNDLTLSYSFIPDRRFSCSAYLYAWQVNNRYVLDYTATATGILRTVRQPGGHFAQLDYGLKGNANLLEGKLQLSGRISSRLLRNGEPYHLRKHELSYYVQAYYYLGSWNFGGCYLSAKGRPESCINGLWVKPRPGYYLSAGWSNDHFNIRCYLYHFGQWNWKSTRTQMQSPAYDVTTQAYSPGDRAFIKLTATYTFSFGKKVRHDDEGLQSRRAATGILE